MSLTKVTEGRHTGEHIISEVAGLSRFGAVITAMLCVVGQVMGRVLSATVTAAGGNTGDGAMGAVTFGALADIGIYKLVCIAASADAGTFQVFRPDGSLLPDLTVATAYAGDHLNMTLADGAADFIVGDSFTIEVTADKYTAHDPAATDGSARAVGILYGQVDASVADANGVISDRLTEVQGDSLTWKTGISAADKAAGIAAMAKQSLFIR